MNFWPSFIMAPSSISGGVDDPYIEAKSETGDDSARPRFSAERMTPFKLSWKAMPLAEYKYLEELFYPQHRAVEFLWRHPSQGKTYVVRFVSSPISSSEDGTAPFVASVEVQLQPLSLSPDSQAQPSIDDLMRTINEGADRAVDAATSAADSRDKAAASATAAKKSETAAAASAKDAAASASTASTKASAAATSATKAKTSETNAANSAKDAAESASTATAKAEEAAEAAVIATTKAGEAATSAGTASTKASAAAKSATAAKTSETNALASKDAAASSATAASKAQKAAEAARDEAQDIANIGPATTAKVGLVKTDGKTVQAGKDGTITVKDVAIGNNLSDLASARGQLGDAKYITITDFNLFTDSGFFWVKWDSSALNAPPYGVNGFVIVSRPGNLENVCRQVVMRWGVAGTNEWQLFTRELTTTNGIMAWSEWSWLLTSKSLGDGFKFSNGKLSVPEYDGATASSAGISGLVPPAAAGQQENFLTGGGGYKSALTKISDSVSLSDSKTAASSKAVKSLSTKLSALEERLSALEKLNIVVTS